MEIFCVWKLRRMGQCREHFGEIPPSPRINEAVGGHQLPALVSSRACTWRAAGAGPRRGGLQSALAAVVEPPRPGTGPVHGVGPWTMGPTGPRCGLPAGRATRGIGLELVAPDKQVPTPLRSRGRAKCSTRWGWWEPGRGWKTWWSAWTSPKAKAHSFPSNLPGVKRAIFYTVRLNFQL